MFWWHKAAALVTAGKLQQFGLITTNSLRQTFNRRVLEKHLGKLHLAFAIPDHPWVDGGDGAAVRIAMTVGAGGTEEGHLLTVLEERATGGEGLEVTLAEKRGLIHADLTIGANVAAAQALRANSGVSSPGFKLHGAGFIVTPEEAAKLEADAPIFDYRNGKDLTDRPRGVRLIDLFGHDAEEVRRRWPATYQRVLETVKPERDAKAHTPDGKGYAKLWWLHGKPRQELRKMLAGLPRYIATVETAKHRVFQFLDKSIAPDNMLIAIALDDAYALGVLSSRAHVVWALAQGGTLEDRPRYNKSRCFETYPFPAVTAEQQARIRDLAEQLDAHRKKVLAAHAELTLTGLYNVLQKLSADRTAKEQAIYEKGLVAVLASFHADLDAAVLDAYGWTDAPADEQLLERLVALNTERRAEEAQGHIRWLRSAFQAPQPRPLPRNNGRKLCPNKSQPSPTPSTLRRNPKPTSQPDSPAKESGNPGSPNCLPPSPRWVGHGSWRMGGGWGKVATSSKENRP